MMSVSAAQSAAVLHVSAVELSTSATVPEVADMLIEPVACVAGSPVVPPAPAASPIKYRPPLASEPARGVTCQVVVAPGLAEMYCTDQPSSATDVLPPLASSMKSLVRVAPLLPPPP